LGGDNDRLASDVALGNHHLLGQKDLAGGDLNTKVTTSNHDTIAGPQNLVEVGNTLLVFDFDDDLDVGTLGTKDGTDIGHILSATNKRSKDHIDTVFNTEEEILLVLLRKSRKIDIGLGKVDALAGGDVSVVDGADSDICAIDGEDKERKNAIVNVDQLARSSDLGQVGLSTVSVKQNIRGKKDQHNQQT